MAVNNLSTSNLSSVSGGTTSTVASVLVDVPAGSVLYHFNSSSSYFVTHEDNLSFLHVSLLSEDGATPLNLNGFDWSATLEIGFELRSAPVAFPSFKDVYNDYVKALQGDKKRNLRSRYL